MRYKTQKCLMSERAVRERVRKRGPHHPITTTQVLLQVRPIHQPQCKDLATSNMELNAAVRDAWGSPPNTVPSPLSSRKASKRLHSAPKPSSFKSTFKIYTPLKSYTLDLNLQHSLQPCSPSSTMIQTLSIPSRPQTACVARQVSTSTTATVRKDIQSSRNTYTSDLKHVACHAGFKTQGKSRLSQNPLDPFRESGGFQLRTDTQLEEYKQSLMQAIICTSPSEERKNRRTSWKPKVKGAPVKNPELGGKTF